MFLWSTIQLIRFWLGLRLLAGVCVGLLICLSAVGYYFRTIEMSDLREHWNTHQEEILNANGLKPGSYGAKLFETRVLNGQPMGFSSSTNTYAALLVMLGIVSAGVVVQRVSDKDDWGWYAVPLAALAGLPLLIHWTACRAAYVTPVLAGLMLMTTCAPGLGSRDERARFMYCPLA